MCTRHQPTCLASVIHDRVHCISGTPLLRRALLILLPALACAACSAPSAPAAFGSSWTPLHRYTAEVQVLPLHQAHRYTPDPADRTLKGLLHRWSAESGATLDYQLAADLSLPAAVAPIRSPSLEQALACLADVYRPYGADIAWSTPGQVAVRPTTPQPAAGLSAACMDDSPTQASAGVSPALGMTASFTPAQPTTDPSASP